MRVWPETEGDKGDTCRYLGEEQASNMNNKGRRLEHEELGQE